jgi:hypothetical protein
MDFLNKMEGWLTAPISRDLPLWKVAVYFVVFSLIAYAVWDMACDL